MGADCGLIDIFDIFDFFAAIELSIGSDVDSVSVDVSSCVGLPTMLSRSTKSGDTGAVRSDTRQDLLDAAHLGH